MAKSMVVKKKKKQQLRNHPFLSLSFFRCKAVDYYTFSNGKTDFNLGLSNTIFYLYKIINTK